MQQDRGNGGPVIWRDGGADVVALAADAGGYGFGAFAGDVLEGGLVGRRG